MEKRKARQSYLFEARYERSTAAKLSCSLLSCVRERKRGLCTLDRNCKVHEVQAQSQYAYLMGAARRKGQGAKGAGQVLVIHLCKEDFTRKPPAL